MYAMHGLTTFEAAAIWAVLGVAILGLLYALLLRSQILREDKGTARMQEVWGWIREGADAYLQRQLKSIIPLIAVLTIAMFFSVYIVNPTEGAIELAHFYQWSDAQAKLYIGLGRAIGFVMGSLFSLTVGQIGMRMAVQANVRVAAEARKSFGGALRIAYRAGTITGMLTDGLGLFGGTIIFIIFGLAAPDALLGFGFGGTLLALFMRVGGGIYTKAADVGADLVGKVEQDLPEDDPRNPAVVADLVGDNVGDCAGMAADIFESYEVTIVSGLILGVALYSITGHLEWIIYPLVVRGIGVLASIFGTYLVKSDDEGKSADAMKAIFRGFLSSAAISTALFVTFGWFYMKDSALPGGWWRTPAAVTIGVVLAILIDRVTEVFTGAHHGGPVDEIKKSADTGAATLILQGVAVGYESAVWTTLVIGLAIFGNILVFTGVTTDPAQQITFILYGVAMTGIGMLTLTGNNVAMDSFGPIADNAAGIGELAWNEIEGDAELDNAQKIMADLDAVGNTTKAITKGVAIGSAVIAAVSLFGSYLVDVTNVQKSLGVAEADYLINTGIRVDIPEVFVGMLIGGALPWLFSSFAIQAVSRASSMIVKEARRQFGLGVLEGTIKPDYSQAVGISTEAAQKELVPLALLGVISPIVVGLALGVYALGGMLAGIIVSGQLLAVFMNNAGGAWDNAKKIIEDEPKDPANNLGKGSERHKASIVGDTVGDPMKDTAGPALNPMIKVVNLVAVIVAPIVVQYADLKGGEAVALWAVVAVLLGLMVWAIRRSKAPVPDLSA